MEKELDVEANGSKWKQMEANGSKWKQQVMDWQNVVQPCHPSVMAAKTMLFRLEGHNEIIAAAMSPLMTSATRDSAIQGHLHLLALRGGM